jgi:threonine dehydrogenase-like Zn-dependent dehydrogenase
MTNVPSRMKCVIWSGPGDLRIETKPVPTLRPATSIIRTRLAGICATDRELVAGLIPGAIPGVVPGHEIMGEIVDSSGPLEFRQGERVVVDTVYDGDDFQYGQRDPRADRAGELGYTADGGWAEYVRVPNARLHRVPDSLSDAAAVIAEPFAMPFGALIDSGEPIDDRHISIVGSGLAAFGFVAAAKALRARRVDVSVRGEERAALFRRIDPQVNVFAEGDCAPEAMADLCVDSIGSSESIRLTMSLARERGLVICYGLSEVAVDAFPLSDIVLRNLRLSGHTNPPNVWPRFMQHLDTGEISTEGLVDRIIAIDAAPDAVLRWGNNLRTVIKF